MLSPSPELNLKDGGGMFSRNNVILLQGYIVSPWRWKQHVHPRRQYPPTKLHCVTIQRTTIWTFNMVLTSEFTDRLFLKHTDLPRGSRGHGYPIRSPGKYYCPPHSAPNQCVLLQIIEEDDDNTGNSLCLCHSHLWNRFLYSRDKYIAHKNIQQYKSTGSHLYAFSFFTDKEEASQWRQVFFYFTSLKLKILSRVRSSMTDINRFWIGWLDLLELLLQSRITAQNRWLPKTRSILSWITRVFSSAVTDLVLIYEAVTSSASVVRCLTLHSWTLNFLNSIRRLTCGWTGWRLQYACSLTDLGMPNRLSLVTRGEP
jgi:hypothetical protein